MVIQEGQQIVGRRQPEHTPKEIISQQIDDLTRILETHPPEKVQWEQTDENVRHEKTTRLKSRYSITGLNAILVELENAIGLLGEYGHNTQNLLTQKKAIYEQIRTIQMNKADMVREILGTIDPELLEKYSVSDPTSFAYLITRGLYNPIGKDLLRQNPLFKDCTDEELIATAQSDFAAYHSTYMSKERQGGAITDKIVIEIEQLVTNTIAQLTNIV